MMKNNIILALVAVLFALTSCKTSQRTTASFHTYPTECVNQDVDGKLLLRAWGTGISGKDATVEAEKKALDDVVFNGIIMGAGNRSQIALLTDGNARKKFENYFVQFFADGGEYTKYVYRPKTRPNAVERTKNKGNKSRGILVVVDVPALKARLIQDGIMSE